MNKIGRHSAGFNEADNSWYICMLAYEVGQKGKSQGSAFYFNLIRKRIPAPTFFFGDHISSWNTKWMWINALSDIQWCGAEEHRGILVIFSSFMSRRVGSLLEGIALYIIAIIAWWISSMHLIYVHYVMSPWKVQQACFSDTPSTMAAKCKKNTLAEPFFMGGIRKRGKHVLDIMEYRIFVANIY